MREPNILGAPTVAKRFNLIEYTQKRELESFEKCIMIIVIMNPFTANEME